MKNIFLLLMVIVAGGCTYVNNEYPPEESNDLDYLPGKEYGISFFSGGTAYDLNESFKEEIKPFMVLGDYERFGGIININGVKFSNVNNFINKYKKFCTITEEKKISLLGNSVEKWENFTLVFDKQNCSIRNKKGLTKKDAYFSGVYVRCKFQEGYVTDGDSKYLIKKDGIFAERDGKYNLLCGMEFTGDFEFNYIYDVKVLEKEYGEEKEEILLDSLETFTYSQKDNIIILKNDEKELRGVFSDDYEKVELRGDISPDRNNISLSRSDKKK